MVTSARQSYGDSEQIYGVPGLPFVPAIRVPAGHDLIFASGTLGLTAADGVPGDIRSETRAAIGNLKKILESAGATLDDVISVTKFLVDIARDYPAVKEVVNEYLGHLPTSTTVEVTRLVPDGARIEINAVAAVPSGSGLPPG